MPEDETKEQETQKKTDKKAKKSESKKKKEKPENTIYVGRKPAMTYVLAVMTCFNDHDADEVRICARGRAISTAVDVAELTRNRFLPDVIVKSIKTSTEQVERREGGGKANVSAIEIVIQRGE
ncbi:MAG: DNA-binding protein Alba [Candidatus Heimdallarchaeota archaeon]|nr:DNA-binding protein Alba [Candidatus Heimdallarchaeota archaeon]